MENIDNATRQQVAEFLPAAIQKALNSYHAFMDNGVDTTTAKEFSEHHKAGKVAISHVELLIKMAEWAGIDKGGEEEKLGKILSGARSEIKVFQKTNSDFSEDDPSDEGGEDEAG